MLLLFKIFTTKLKTTKFFSINKFIWCLLICVLSIIDKCDAIKCYKCAVTAEKYFSRDSNSTISVRMCSKFDESEEFQINCPYSTMCLKTISTLVLQNGEPLETFTRGCAQQKDTTQVFRNRSWQQEHSIQEVYEEGCHELKNNFLAGTIVTHCYCRGNLCNSSRKNSLAYSFQLIGILFVINFMIKLI